MKISTIHLTITLDGQAAAALAQFLKRSGYQDYRANAADEQEAYWMQQAGEAVRAALAVNGIRPR